MHGERLEQWCSCASNCAHLHSRHHPPRRPENRSFQRMAHGSTGLGVDRQKGKERELEGRASRAPSTAILTICMTAPLARFSFKHFCCSLAKRMLLLTSSCSSSCTTAIKQNALFMKPFSQIHIATWSVCCVCTYFNWKDSSKVFGVRLAGRNIQEFEEMCDSRSRVIYVKIMFYIRDFNSPLPTVESRYQSGSAHSTLSAPCLSPPCRFFLQEQYRRSLNNSNHLREDTNHVRRLWHCQQLLPWTVTVRCCRGSMLFSIQCAVK